MKICFIGASGHFGYAIDGLHMIMDEIDEIGVAAGSVGEAVEPLYRMLKDMKLNVRIYEDYKSMLDELKPDIAVINCYFCDHAEAAIEAVNRGVHVFVEKPVATELRDLERLIKAYEPSGVQLAAMFGMRYDSAFFTAWEAVKSGAIGQVRLMNAQKSYKLGVRGENFKQRKLSGGTIPWVGSHAIDWLYWIGGVKFRSVHASHSCLFNKNHHELEVTAICHFTMEKEVSASVSIDYLRPGSAVSHADDRLRAVGTKGIIEIHDESVYIINDNYNGVLELLKPESGHLFLDFVKQTKGEGKCLVSDVDSFYVTEACLRARQAADEEKIVYF